jgi:hypothetical protein
VGQDILGGGSERVEKMRVSWGVLSRAIVGVDKMEGGKGLSCARSKGFGKVQGWGPIFTWKAKGR